MPASTSSIDLNRVMEREEQKVMEICQLISKPYTLFKLYPGVCYREIANKENYDRIQFFIILN